MTKNVPIRGQHRNASLHPQLELFSWRRTPPYNASRAALQLAKRFGLSVDHASTVARLAGIGGTRHEA
jgi:hypothetical protein